MTRIALYPGSFDPVTVGHVDVIARASSLFDEVRVVIFHNAAKHGWLTAAQRKELLEAATAPYPNVTVEIAEGLTTDYAKKIGAACMVRGIRNTVDFEAEKTLAALNQRISGVETVFLMTAPELECVSSSAVRELVYFGKSPEGFVPAQCMPILERFLSEKK